MREIVVTITYYRPEYGEKVIFLRMYPKDPSRKRLMTSDTDEKIREIFAKAFKMQYPNWQIKEVRVC